MNEKEYVEKLAEQADDTVDLLSSRRKGERERMICAAFLRCLGIEFSPEEITLPESDPPDVVFRDARFEVMIIIDEDRKMHADWKVEANKRHAATRLDDLGAPYHPSSPMEPAKVADRLVAELAKKASHYGPKTCLDLDALVYINLQKWHLYPISQIKVPEELRSQGWRSVSFIFSPYSHVVFTTSEAPDLLRGYEGRVKQECKNPGGMFEL